MKHCTEFCVCLGLTAVGLLVGSALLACVAAAVAGLYLLAGDGEK